MEICHGESDIEAIKFETFIKLLVLASCAGDRSKLGQKNFLKLLKHIRIA